MDARELAWLAHRVHAARNRTRNYRLSRLATVGADYNRADGREGPRRTRLGGGLQANPDTLDARESVLRSFLPGEIYWADFPEVGRRPIVVVSREELNRGTYVVVVPVTSSQLEKRRALPNCVPLRQGQFGLPKDCVIQSESIACLAKSDIDVTSGPVGILNATAMRDLTHAIGYVFAADCEPA